MVIDFKALLKAIQIFTVCVLLSSFAVSAQGKVAPKSQSAQKIAKLKKALSEAKGQKRAKLIKKIAEMENKVLEHKLQSFR